MTELVKKISSEINTLSSTLLETLDESIFFIELSNFFSKYIHADEVQVFSVFEDLTTKLIVKNGQKVENGTVLKKGEGLTGHVVRTKKSYFSNNIHRDPIFCDSKDNDMKAELCIPVAHEGIVLAAIHFKRKEGSEDFSLKDITFALSIMSAIKKPVANIKMFLAAKNLNEVLLKKIEQKEKELEEKKLGLNMTENYKIHEREIVGKSELLTQIVKLADKMACNDVNFLIQGEAGSGKELLARRIHCRSSRANKAMIVMDCASYTEAQLETEIFGKESGDFSECRTIKRGVLESANGGTLLLGNVDALTPSLQTKVFHFMEEKMAFRVNGQVPYRALVRIVATTEKNLMELVEEGHFRKDLFYSLNTMVINIPPLRERKEDVEFLANYFLNNSRSIDEQKSFSPGVIKALKEYSWPGNVRELQSVVERAYILSDGIIIEKNHLPSNVLTGDEMVLVAEENQDSFKEMTLDELERKHICLTLEHLGGNKTKTAKTLGITVKTLYNKLHNYGMLEEKQA